MKSLFITPSLFVSLAHRYWVEELSKEENDRIFGSSASSKGLGHDLEVSPTFSASLGENRRQEILSEITKHWDHSSWLSLRENECSSVEVIAWDLVHRFRSDLEALMVRESPKLWVKWHRLEPEKMNLGYRRDVSVLWKEGGGARLIFHFNFQDLFETRKHVLFPRTLLEEVMEKALIDMESSGLLFSKEVKENERIMDAMFKTLCASLPHLVSMDCELEKQKKWLNHRPFETR